MFNLTTICEFFKTGNKLCVQQYSIKDLWLQASTHHFRGHYLGLCKTFTMKMVRCAGCNRPILDRFLLNVLDRSWHAKCVRCCECKCTMTDKCFSRDNKLYCRTDFFRRFGTKCSGCGQGISPTDLVRRARTKVFHLSCFTCLVCRKQLSTGEELYVLDEHRFVCMDDYVNSRHKPPIISSSPPGQTEVDESNDPIVDSNDPIASSNKNKNEHSLDREVITRQGKGGTIVNSPVSDCYTSPVGVVGSTNGNSQTTGSEVSNNVNDHKNTNDSDGQNSSTSSTSQNFGTNPNDENAPGSKRRGPRTTIKAKQLEMLKAAFAATPKPTRHIREQLAQETGLNMRVIQVWFQNRRSKERRIKQLSSLGVRRHFYRGPRRAMRPLRSGLSPEGLDDSPEMMGGPNSGFAYFSDSGSPCDFPYGPHGPYDYFSVHQTPEGIAFPPGTMVRTPASGGIVEQRMGSSLGSGHNSIVTDGPCLHVHTDLTLHRSSPDMRPCMIPDGYCQPRSALDSMYHGGLSHRSLSETPVW